jgi:transposase
MLKRFKGGDAIKGCGLKIAKCRCHARAAVARKLATVMHAMWRDGTDYIGRRDVGGRGGDLDKGKIGADEFCQELTTLCETLMGDQTT